jgi:hypothetical protein
LTDFDTTEPATSRRPRAAKPRAADLPTRQVRDFRTRLTEVLDSLDDEGRQWGNAKWGVYAFYDYDGEPIYVGQTNESLRVRVRRHLTNQRTDAVAMRILDVFEVAEMELWPLWHLQQERKDDPAAKSELNALEYSVYLSAIDESQFKAILNEKIPPQCKPIELPRSDRFDLIGADDRIERGHPDVRIARRAETISRLAAVAHERGEVSAGLRRVLVVQAVRLAYLSAARFAQAQGLPGPNPGAIDVEGLIGTVTVEDEAPRNDADEGLSD